MTDLRINGKGWEALAELASHIDEQQDELADIIEKAAKLVLDQTRGWTRAFQYPTLTNCDEFGASFDVTNGIDYDDDFSTEISWDKLNDAANVKFDYPSGDVDTETRRYGGEIADGVARLDDKSLTLGKQVKLDVNGYGTQ